MKRTSIFDPEYKYGYSWSKVTRKPARCIMPVRGPQGGGIQCSRKDGHGKDGLFCKQHAIRYPAGADPIQKA